MFSRLLIANRGEIACRIMRTCRRIGIATIAVYSDADAHARHVREADIAERIGASEAHLSYLDADALMAAAHKHGADAIHPGYGFLSEKLALIDACQKVGVAFIGPHRDAIERMGSKIESKTVARSAGIQCVPGYDGDDQSVARLTAAAEAIGFPLLIKASAGGGGKGMRRVDRLDAFVDQLSAARREAMAAFADDSVLLERFVQSPRHLEVQLLGDHHGNMVHLFERECSIQRNYQKIIEEAPANHLMDATRERLFADALAIGRAIGYDSAGTVEFVLDAECHDEPYFLEMNTRLQVEHPVTEMTTGVDLVEWQIRVAAGEALTFAQTDLHRTGWAIEARINAEVPTERFRASIGKILDYRERDDLAGVRIDSGVDTGSDVTPHYDSLLAKVIAFGATRDAALARLLGGIRNLRIAGVQTNQSLLAAIVTCPAFDDVLTTRFLTTAFPEGYALSSADVLERASVAAAAWLFSAIGGPRADTPLAALLGFRLTSGAGRRARYAVRVRAIAEPESAARRAFIEFGDTSTLEIRIGDFITRAKWCEGEIVCTTPTRSRSYVLSRGRDDVFGLWTEGDYCELVVRSDVIAIKDAHSAVDSGDVICAELPGLVAELLIRQGDAVVRGAPVAIMEAMKLFHTLTAPRDGIVKAVAVKVGAIIAQGTLLFELEPANASAHEADTLPSDSSAAPSMPA